MDTVLNLFYCLFFVFSVKSFPHMSGNSCSYLREVTLGFWFSKKHWQLPQSDSLS